MRYEGKSVLVTGAASGIGRAVALAFAREGARVTIGDTSAAAEETVEAILSEGGHARYHATDVSDKSQVANLIAVAETNFGPIDAAFNNAGVYPAEQSFADFDEDSFDRVIAVDLKGVFLCVQAEIRSMLQNGGGAIVNTASVAGVVANPNMSAYVAAKHGVIGLTRAAAIEYARAGIRANAICPGLVQTPMTQTWFDNPEFVEAFMAVSPMGRAAQAEEMAGMVLHLCSDEASFTNGSVIVMDGGQTAI